MEKPADAIYLPVLNAANAFIGGVDVAGAIGEPLLFLHGQNWLLHVPSGREHARMVISYMSGRFVEMGHAFQAAWQSFTTSVKDA